MEKDSIDLADVKSVMAWSRGPERSMARCRCAYPVVACVEPTRLKTERNCVLVAEFGCEWWMFEAKWLRASAAGADQQHQRQRTSATHSLEADPAFMMRGVELD